MWSPDRRTICCSRPAASGRRLNSTIYRHYARSTHITAIDEDNREDKNTSFLERFIVLCTRTRRWSWSTTAGRRVNGATSHHLCLGWTSSWHGFYGNVVYAPSARGKNTKGRVEDEDPHPRRELHLLRPGQSDPRIGFADPPGFGFADPPGFVAFASGPR
jgi:hypothetical protein